MSIYITTDFTYQPVLNTGSIILRDLELIKVVLKSSTARRRGKASLVVGQDQTRDQIVDGNRNVFENPSYDSQGRWQIHLRGNFTVNKVVVVVREPRRGGQIQFTEVEKFKAPKFIESVETIRIGGQLVSAIKLAASKNKAYISSVEVEYDDGTTERLYDLEGKLREGREVVTNFGRSGEYIHLIRITSTTPSFSGSRARVHVSVGKRSRRGGGRNDGGRNGGRRDGGFGGHRN